MALKLVLQLLGTPLPNAERVDLMATSTVTLTMARRFQTTEEKVFAAWTKPELMKKWLFTTEATNQKAVNQPVQGGSWEIIDRRGGTDYRAIGNYIEVSPPHKLVFTFEMPQFNSLEDRITVWISSVENSVEMAFIQEIVVPHEEGWTDDDIKRAGMEFSGQSEEGWDQMFQNLQQLVEKPASDEME